MLHLTGWRPRGLFGRQGLGESALIVRRAATADAVVDAGLAALARDQHARHSGQPAQSGVAQKRAPARPGQWCSTSHDTALINSASRRVMRLAGFCARLRIYCNGVAKEGVSRTRKTL